MPPDTPIESLSEGRMTVNAKTLGIALLAIINLLIIGPGGWLVSSYIDRYAADLAANNQRIVEIHAQMERLGNAVYYDMVPRKLYDVDREQFNTRLQDLSDRINDMTITLLESDKANK